MTDVQADESLDLYKRLVDLLYSLPYADRQRAHWVMSTEWQDKITDYAKRILGTPEPPAAWMVLLGLPFKVDDSCGFPALVVEGA